MWCSDPVLGSALAFGEHLELENQPSQLRLSGEQTISLINRTAEALRSEYEGDFYQSELFSDVTRYLPESMSLYEFENNS